MPNLNNEIQKAAELIVPKWIDSSGNETKPIKLADFEGKFKVIYCFQHWCAGCHSVGFPSLQKMTNALLKNEKVVFFAIQTVFEGKNENTFEKIKETQEKYKLKIPFGHDEGSEKSNNISTIMRDFKTGGTPWFLFIDQNNNIVFSNFHLNTDAAIEYLKEIK